MEFKISYRIKVLAECVKECCVLADVGCDHGFVPYLLLRNGVCRKAILIDISFKSLNKARKLFLKSGLENHAEFRQGGGLTVLKTDEADFAVIAGLGGVEIIDILKADDKGVRRFLLQPMKNTRLLREFLVKNNFKLEKDFIIFEKNHFYDIIVTSKGSDILTEAELEFGKDNLKNKTKDFIKFLNYKKIQTEKILNKVNGKRKEELLNYLKLIESIMK